ncbi:MAG: glycosyltransferase [Flavobacteriales bacterium]|nr:glycosyltransferase [Flavobacteriales bacterium]
MLHSSSTPKPLVSILMPAYNCEKFVAKALDSIVAQTYPHWELLAADDGSWDSTRRILNDYAVQDKRIRTFHQDVNQGYLKTWNRLLGLAKGDYITFQDADDWSAPERLDKLLTALEKNPGWGAVGSNYARVNEAGQILFTSQFETEPEKILQRMPEKFDFIGSALMVRRAVVDKIGGYHLAFDRIGAEDLYWAYRVAECSGIANVPDVLYYYRYNPSSVGGNLSDSHRKFISGAMVKKAIEERQRSGTDYLERNDPKEIRQIVEELEAPYLQDPGLFFERLGRRYFNEGRKAFARKLMWKSWLKTPHRLQRLRDFIYMLRN